MPSDKEIIKESILFFQNHFVPTWIERELVLPMSSGKIITVIGPRRAGKTHILLQHIHTLLKHKVPHKHILYLNMEDERINYSNFQPDTILQAYTELYPDVSYSKIHIFLDEIQYIPNWEKFIRRIYDTYTKNIYLTGSNSAFLQYNISTSLRGRTISYPVFPLSFKEFLRFKDFKYEPQDLYLPKRKAKIINYFKEYMLFGGFPEIVTHSSDMKIKILQEYIHVMLYKDLIEQYKIPDVTILKFLLRRLIDSTGKLFSVHKVFNELKSSGIKTGKNTLYDYLKYLEDVFAIYILHKHFQSPVKTELTDRKIYPIDNGYVQAFKYVHSEYYGVMLENTIRQFLIQKNHSIFFLRDTKEVDFVCFDKKEKPLLVQVCLSIDSDETMQREIAALSDAAQKYKVKEAYVLTLDEEKELQVGKLTIHIMPAYKYILQNT